MQRTSFPALILLLGILLAGCQSTRVKPAPFDAAKLAAMDAAVTNAIADQKCPGGVLWIERNQQSYHKAYGNRALVPEDEPMTEDTIFDAASLTKVLATTPAVMKLVEQGKVSLNGRATEYLPEFAGQGRDAITIRHLLTHTSGLPPGISTTGDWQGQSEAFKRACAAEVQSLPGSTFRYSDINFILLGVLVERMSGTGLDQFVRHEFYEPLKMEDTGYLPGTNRLARVAPTEVVAGDVLRGVVHDPTARKMGGVAGHAGLFTTASDLARFARMMLHEGELDGVRVLKVETVQQMTSSQTTPALETVRGLGWDIRSPYSNPRGRWFSAASFGHTGWTGTSIWIDPKADAFVIFLSNRNHPTEDGSVKALRETLGTLAAEAMGLGGNTAQLP
jgi:CubicO group peptidase (beta-lactamase class C family)